MLTLGSGPTVGIPADRNSYCTIFKSSGACHARNAFAKHMGGTERLKAAWATGKEWAGIARSNPARTMKLLSAVSGALLIVGGISGVINIFNPLGIVISIYNM